MPVSDRMRGTDAGWRAGIAHEGAMLAMAALGLGYRHANAGQYDPTRLLEPGPSAVKVAFVAAQLLFLQNGPTLEVEIAHIGRIRRPVLHAQ